MRKRDSISEIFRDTARQKFEAAQARSSCDLGADKPRDVILGACAVISESLKEDGYSFFRSGPKLKRTSGDLTFEIFFQSDMNNIAGRRAAVWIHAGVSSAKLAKWRAAHPSPWIRRTGNGSGRITGAQIGNLSDDPTWMEWDFADAPKRQEEIESAIATIREVIFPFFALFEDADNAVQILARHQMLQVTSLLEYALSTLGLERAEAAGRSYLAANPQIRSSFEAAYAQFSEHGLPEYRSTFSSDLAALALATDMDLTRPRIVK